MVAAFAGHEFRETCVVLAAREVLVAPAEEMDPAQFVEGEVAVEACEGVAA